MAAVSSFERNGFNFVLRLRTDPAGGFFCDISCLQVNGQLQSESWPSSEEAFVDAGQIADDWSVSLAAQVARGDEVIG